MGVSSKIFLEISVIGFCCLIVKVSTTLSKKYYLKKNVKIKNIGYTKRRGRGRQKIPP